MHRPDPTISEVLAPADERDAHSTQLTMGAALERAARKWGEREAVVYRHQPSVGDVSWTYAELDALAVRLAAALVETGYRPGERIAVWGPNHPEWILLEYAIAKAGLVIVALNPLYRQSELEFVLQDSACAGIFHADTIGAHVPSETIEQVRADTPALRHVHSFSSIWTDLLRHSPEKLAPIDIDPARTFMIQYTSGTTGVPKAVRLSHQAITTTGRNSYRRWGLDEHSRVCPGFPLFHVGGSGNSVPGACLNGATLLPLHIFKPTITLDILERERCTSFIGVPTMLIAMLEDPTVAHRDFAAMESIIVGGAPVTRDLLHRCQSVFGADVINCYGQTETCGVTATTRFEDSVEKKTETSGKPLVGVSISIRDDAGKPVPLGEVGQLFYKGPGAMTGYGNDEDGQAPDVDAWIASGDLARMDAAGFIAIAGRKKEMIIRGGENLSPVEIETYMKEHEAIGDVSVIAVPDAKYGEVACAVVRLLPGHRPSGDAIRQWCSERISRWKVPEYVEFVEDFPMTPSGKIQKFILQETMTERLGLAAHAINENKDAKA
ncbi:AMP-dependent synthetase [Croceicoccus estronivorus]|uniref:AMP-binding protein n=1 Tax=Croceicoccus estronivorus TaxID=1172626 RepID=UPI00082D5ED4|nr:AMP-binding protein [Croceicoccus estronivorus]OCC25625.1 AMP-dependent synthetase [Croceicoccus estronivorus]